MNWYNTDVDTVFQQLSASRQGLTTEQVDHRLAEYGKNVLAEKKKKPAWVLFLLQFKDFMIVILIAAAIISGFLGDTTDTIVILLIVFLNAIVGFVQEYRAEKAMEALKKMATPHASVLRNKTVTVVPSEELVPGDLVLLEAGNLVPADIRLVETHSLRIVESSLTGESVPVDKSQDALTETDLPLGDRFNMAYKGTHITNGRATGIVTDTGMKTELGKIAAMLQQEESVTPLQNRLTDFGKKLTYLIIGICIVLFFVGYLRGQDPLTMLLLSISLAVAAIPEALPALITIALAQGAKRLVRKNVLIRKLPAVETLGSVTYICSDKTGTLTQNKMTVVEVFPLSTSRQLGESDSFLNNAMVLNQDVKRDKEGNWMGDPTEIAMVAYVNDQNGQSVGTIQGQYPRVGELPFDSDRKRMTTIHAYGDQFIAISKGALESIIAIINDHSDEQMLVEKASEMASNGIRVLAFCYRLFDKKPAVLSVEDIEKEMTLAGLVGMIDPPREEIPASIRECKTAGIQPVMITGDHKETAAAIARQIGILDEDGLVVTGAELQKLSNEDFHRRVERIRVYARVSPQQKLDIVRALQDKKHFVAMTGDGVNDAPSLKMANIGIAMGITGTDVSKEASHMILLDDNFATIVRAIREGRRIYDNIRKFVKYIMTCNSAEIWTIFMAPLVGLPIPLLPIHILWINLVTDGLPGLTLSAEKAEANIMRRPPRRTTESLFSEGISYHIVWVGILMAAVTLGVQAWALHTGNAHWQTEVFTVLSLSQLGHVMAIRSDYEYIYRKGFLTNMPLLGAIVLTFLLQMSIIYLPIANEIFKTQPLTFEELLFCLGASSIVFFAVEIEKWVKRHF
ncbi:cation-translocating P-type ATPase [Flavisolibacter tropicus]|uniref:ATPase n=1 Tax=Flavisolibacter tropicus TaxID=1492898 RepID=A0A172U1D3_9BACT|nr:cation-translocating P-type ATPase [Flavisolibacter tropicus]ANE53161.1 ATPase [Flavisolibacter tropicus]